MMQGRRKKNAQYTWKGVNYIKGRAERKYYKERKRYMEQRVCGDQERANGAETLSEGLLINNFLKMLNNVKSHV